MDLSEDVLHQFAAWAATQPTALDLWLFGSRARGDHRPDSDVDLAIHLAGPGGDALGLYIVKEQAWEAELAAIAGHPVGLELLGFSPELDAIVAREGVWIWSRA